MAHFTKIIPFPSALIRLATARPASGSTYPRFAKAFGNRPAGLLPTLLPVPAGPSKAS